MPKGRLDKRPSRAFGFNTSGTVPACRTLRPVVAESGETTGSLDTSPLRLVGDSHVRLVRYAGRR